MRSAWNSSSGKPRPVANLALRCLEPGPEAWMN
jgi:hypothetical protein